MISSTRARCSVTRRPADLTRSSSVPLSSMFVSFLRPHHDPPRQLLIDGELAVTDPANHGRTFARGLALPSVAPTLTPSPQASPQARGPDVLVAAARAANPAAVRRQNTRPAGRGSLFLIVVMAAEWAVQRVTPRAPMAFESSQPTRKANGKMNPATATAIFHPRSLSITENCATHGRKSVSVTAATVS